MAGKNIIRLKRKKLNINNETRKIIKKDKKENIKNIKNQKIN